MASLDNRLTLSLSPAEQAALQRAVLLADRRDLAARLGLAASEAPEDVPATLPAEVDAGDLEAMMAAVRRSCLLRFRYKGR